MSIRGFIAESGWRYWTLRLPMAPTTRAKLLRRYGATVGSNVRVHPLTVMDAGWAHLTIEDDVYIGPDCILDLSAPLTIRRGAVLAAGVAVMTHQDAGTTHHSPTAERIGTYLRPVTVGEYAFVGVRATLLTDVGDGAVIGAGAVLVRPAPPQATLVGVPARSRRP